MKDSKTSGLNDPKNVMRRLFFLQNKSSFIISTNDNESAEIEQNVNSPSIAFSFYGNKQRVCFSYSFKKLQALYFGEAFFHDIKISKHSTKAQMLNETFMLLRFLLSFFWFINISKTLVRESLLLRLSSREKGKKFNQGWDENFKVV